MREFLVVKFVCSKCGDNLEPTYDVPKNAGPHVEGEPTGGDMVQQKIAIHPCRRCVTWPIEDVRKAMQTLLNI